MNTKKDYKRYYWLQLATMILRKGNEAFYHGLIMGMGLYLEGEYITKSNIESGLGRYDFIIEPKE